MQSLSDEIYYGPPRSFTRKRLVHESNLFKHRAALFYTATKEIPKKFIGSGPLDVILPLPSPTMVEYKEIRGYRNPRLWVELLQRATKRIRWEPIRPAQVTFIRYDSDKVSLGNLWGIKALLDALKFRTTGRGGGRLLYYFGAIWDDSPKWVKVDVLQRKVNHPAKARCRVIVRPLLQ